MTINEILLEVLNKISRKKELTLLDPNSFIEKFHDLHITQRIPLGIIHEDTLPPFSSRGTNTAFAPKVHHSIIKLIYEKIWKPSRTSTNNTQPRPHSTPPSNKSEHIDHTPEPSQLPWLNSLVNYNYKQMNYIV